MTNEMESDQLARPKGNGTGIETGGGITVTNLSADGSMRPQSERTVSSVSSTRVGRPSVSTEAEVPMDLGWQERAVRVERRTVLKHWYARECEKYGVDAEKCDPCDRTDDELLTPIVEVAGSAARPVCTDRARWYRVCLSEPEFRRLRVTGSADQCWKCLAPDERVMTAARTIRDVNSQFSYPSVDRSYVLEMARRDIDMKSATARDPPVLFSQSDGAEPRLLDGNHRTAATALKLLERGEFDGMYAYLGVDERGSLNPLRSMIRSLYTLVR